MPLQTKLVLSAKQRALLQNVDWFLTKKEITDKVYGLLQGLVPAINEFILETGQGAQLQTQPPKIYKGENYRGLPYVMLDYPRWFDKEQIFAVRTLFWWGNFFSLTLHVSGSYRQTIADKLPFLQQHFPEVYVCIHAEQWHHHFEADNYVPVLQMSKEQLQQVSEKKFIKIAWKFSLSQEEDLDARLIEGYKKIGELLN